jgi:two-component system, OmpR family, sensor kinase
MSSSRLSDTSTGGLGRRPGRWSLRTRLMVAMILLLALGFLVVGVTTVVTLNDALYCRIDGQLTAAASRGSEGFRNSDCSRPYHADFPAGQGIGTLSVRSCAGRNSQTSALITQRC